MGVCKFRIRLEGTSQSSRMVIAKIFSLALDANFQKLSMYSMADVEEINVPLKKNSSMLLHVTVVHSFIL